MNNRKTIKCKCQATITNTKSNSREKRPISSTKSTIKNLVKRNNMLQQQNYLLKQQSSFLNPPSLLKSTLPAKQNNCLVLQDKLFHANRTLQQTIMNLDAESEANKVLELRVSEQELMIKRLQHQRNNLLDEIDKCRFKLQKYMTIGKNSSTSKLQSRIKGTLDYNQDVFEKYNKLLEAHSNLQQKYEVLEQQLTAQNLLEKANMKMNIIERNITKIEQNNEQLLGNLNEEYDKFKDDVIEYFKNISNGLKVITSNTGEIRNFRSAKQQTYRNLDFKQISQRYNIPKMISDLLSLVSDFIEQETKSHQLVIDSMLVKLEAKFNRVTQKYSTITKIIQKPKSKIRRFSQHNNENVNISNRLQNSFY